MLYTKQSCFSNAVHSNWIWKKSWAGKQREGLLSVKVYYTYGSHKHTLINITKITFRAIWTPNKLLYSWGRMQLQRSFVLAKSALFLMGQSKIQYEILHFATIFHGWSFDTYKSLINDFTFIIALEKFCRACFFYWMVDAWRGFCLSVSSPINFECTEKSFWCNPLLFSTSKYFTSHKYTIYQICLHMLILFVTSWPCRAVCMLYA